MIEQLELRQLSKSSEYAACVKLQRTTWGPGYTDIVPASLLKVSQTVGGIVAGAFLGDRLIGFVYGLAGVRERRPIHWSHMLAVDPEYRDQGVGRRLKQYQRSLLYEAGAELAYWTFDPLQARNAHLNVNRLCALPCEYVSEMYHDTGSELHAFGTDRFVVCWQVLPPNAVNGDGTPVMAPAWRSAPIVNANPSSSNGAAPDAATLLAECNVIRVEIPADIDAVAASDLSLARAWRTSTRIALVSSTQQEFQVAGFFRDESGRCYYVLRRVTR